MKTNLRKIQVGLLLLGALFCTTPRAKAVPLFDLLQPGAELTSGDMIFFGFHNWTQRGDLNIPATEILVEPIGGSSAFGMEFGIRFSSSAWSLTGPGQEYDFGLDFHVRTVSGAPLITDNTLKLAGEYTGDGMASVAESVIDPHTGKSLATKFAFMDKFGVLLEHHQVFPGGPYTEIEISKDFAMITSAALDSRITVRHFDQTFSQVPEGGPGLLSTLSVMCILCCAAHGHFRKRVR